jgi:hypothetical protein
MMPVCPHEKKVWKSPVLKKHGLKQGVFQMGLYQSGDEIEYHCKVQKQKHWYKQKFCFEGFMAENIHRAICSDWTNKCQDK